MPWEDEDHAIAKHDALVEELAQFIEANAGGWQYIARKLVESGWRKEQP